MRTILAASLALACSASPPEEAELPAVAVFSDVGPIKICPVELREKYLLASQEIWGAVIDCSLPDYEISTAQLGNVEIAGKEWNISGEVLTLATDDEPGLILVDVDYWGGNNPDAYQLVEFILAHELGHALGYDHVCEVAAGNCTEADRSELMYPIVDWSAAFFAAHPRDYE
jgi:hypothetical protein